MPTLQLSDDMVARLSALAESKNLPLADVLEEAVSTLEHVEQQPEHTDASNQLELAVKAAHLGIWTLDLETRVVTWNDELFKIYGITQEEFDKSVVNWENAVHPDDFVQANLRLREAENGNSVYDVLFRIIRPDGETRYISGAATPIFNDDGEVVKIIGNNLDITPIKTAEYQLMDQANILRHVTDAIITTDTQFNILTWNHRAEVMYGYLAEAVIGKSMGEVVHHVYEDTAPEQAALELFETGRWQGEVLQHHANGDPIHVMASVSVIRDENGDARGFVAVNRDITAQKESKRLQMEHDALQGQLESEQELAELRATMMSTIAHELRTPLSVVISSADMLNRYHTLFSQNQFEEHIRKILLQAERLDNMIDELNTLAKAERGYLELHIDQIDIKTFCEDIIDNFTPLLSDQHNLSLSIDETINMIQMDGKLMKMAVSNLLSNSIKYSPEGGQITFQVKANNGEVIFIVSDEGIGIPEDDKDTLLDPFMRADNVSDIRGSGLGLSIVREVIKQHHGNIDFQSSIGEGTEFRLLIPRHRPAG